MRSLANVHSFLGDVIKNMTEREEALGGVDEVSGARWDLVVPAPLSQ